MRRSLLLLVVMSTALVFSGCPKKKKAAGTGSGTAAAAKGTGSAAAGTGAAAKGSAASQPAGGTAAAAAGTGTGSAAAAAAGGDAEKNCGAMYDMMQKMIAALTKKFGKGKTKGKMPDRATYVAACKELPAPVIRCMNPKVAMKEPKKCAAEMKKVDKSKLAKFQAMMKPKK